MMSRNRLGSKLAASKEKIQRLEHEFYLKQEELPAYGSGIMDDVNNNKLQRKRVKKKKHNYCILSNDFFFWGVGGCDRNWIQRASLLMDVCFLLLTI